MLVVGTPGFQDRVRVPVASLLENSALRIPLLSSLPLFRGQLLE